MQANLYPISPFDAAAGTVIKFSWLGNQAFQNRCVIKKNDTNQVVYDHTMDSFKFEHPIDLSLANLVNGERYSAYITVFTSDGRESEPQQIGEPFLCLKAPIFTFDNIAEGQTLSVSSYNFILNYSQENGELLDTWNISLCTRSHSLLSSSQNKFDTNQMNFTFSGFSNKTEYCVRGKGKTVNGMEVDTGYVNFSVTYQIKDVFSLLEPTNLPRIGAIQIRSNITSSEGHSKHPAVYIDGEYVDLRDNEIVFSEGFVLKEDFSLVLVFYGAQSNQNILILGENQEEFTAVTCRAGRFGSVSPVMCCELSAVSAASSYTIFSNQIDVPGENDKIGLCLYRKNGLYDMEITNLGEVV